MTETPINSEIREKPHRFVLPGAWGLGKEEDTVRSRRIAVDSPVPWGRWRAEIDAGRPRVADYAIANRNGTERYGREALRGRWLATRKPSRT